MHLYHLGRNAVPPRGSNRKQIVHHGRDSNAFARNNGAAAQEAVDGKKQTAAAHTNQLAGDEDNSALNNISSDEASSGSGADEIHNTTTNKPVKDDKKLLVSNHVVFVLNNGSRNANTTSRTFDNITASENKTDPKMLTLSRFYAKKNLTGHGSNMSALSSDKNVSNIENVNNLHNLIKDLVSLDKSIYLVEHTLNMNKGNNSSYKQFQLNQENKNGLAGKKLNKLLSAFVGNLSNSSKNITGTNNSSFSDMHENMENLVLRCLGFDKDKSTGLTNRSSSNNTEGEIYSEFHTPTGALVLSCSDFDINKDQLANAAKFNPMTSMRLNFGPDQETSKASEHDAPKSSHEAPKSAEQAPKNIDYDIEKDNNTKKIKDENHEHSKESPKNAKNVKGFANSLEKNTPKHKASNESKAQVAPEEGKEQAKNTTVKERARASLHDKIKQDLLENSTIALFKNYGLQNETDPRLKELINEVINLDNTTTYYYTYSPGENNAKNGTKDEKMKPTPPVDDIRHKQKEISSTKFRNRENEKKKVAKETKEQSVGHAVPEESGKKPSDEKPTEEKTSAVAVPNESSSKLYAEKKPVEKAANVTDELKNNAKNETKSEEEHKEISKEEAKEESKEEAKEESKEEIKEEAKAENKEESKEASKEEAKEENKEKSKEGSKEENKKDSKEENKEKETIDKDKEEFKSDNKDENDNKENTVQTFKTQTNVTKSESGSGDNKTTSENIEKTTQMPSENSTAPENKDEDDFISKISNKMDANDGTKSENKTSDLEKQLIEKIKNSTAHLGEAKINTSVTKVKFTDKDGNSIDDISVSVGNTTHNLTHNDKDNADNSTLVEGSADDENDGDGNTHEYILKSDAKNNSTKNETEVMFHDDEGNAKESDNSTVNENPKDAPHKNTSKINDKALNNKLVKEMNENKVNKSDEKISDDKNAKVENDYSEKNNPMNKVENEKNGDMKKAENEKYSAKLTKEMSDQKNAKVENDDSEKNNPMNKVENEKNGDMKEAENEKNSAKLAREMNEKNLNKSAEAAAEIIAEGAVKNVTAKLNKEIDEKMNQTKDADQKTITRASGSIGDINPGSGENIINSFQDNSISPKIMEQFHGKNADKLAKAEKLKQPEHGTKDKGSTVFQDYLMNSEGHSIDLGNLTNVHNEGGLNFFKDQGGPDGMTKKKEYGTGVLISQLVKSRIVKYRSKNSFRHNIHRLPIKRNKIKHRIH